MKNTTRIRAMRLFGTFLAVVLGLSAEQSARGGTITNIDISPYYNHPWFSAINGWPVSQAPTNGSTGSGYTFANYNGNFVRVGPDSFTHTLTITFNPVALTADSKVHTLFNTTYGVAGTVNAVVVFTNSAGQNATFDLVGGQTIRDYNESTYDNNLTGHNANPAYGSVTAENWWNDGASGQRLDMQTFVLPSTWNGTTLTGVTITDPYTSAATADPVLSAMQVDTASAPEPGTLGLLGVAGLGMLSFMQRARRRMLIPSES